MNLHKYLARPIEYGRITLTGNVLKITNNGEITERQLQSEEEVFTVLWDYFKIRI